MARQGHLTAWLCVIAVAVAMPGRTTQAGGQPPCPADCGQPTDKQVGIIDFLTLLAQWDMIGTSCDLDGDGVGITDFLLLLANWGPCPTPPNDECLDKIIIDRLDSPGSIKEPFDLFGATPSPETSQCTGVDPNPFKDLWYCLQNNTGESKIVTLTGDVDLLAEVTEGCACPPGPLVTCGRLTGGVTTFTMQAGDAVCIRLINDLDLPNDQIAGTLTINNAPPAPPNDECLDKIIIDRLDSPGSIKEPFDLSGATPSPETSQCTGVDPNPFKDLWYCLQNNTGESKIVTLTGDVDLLAEVAEGCACPPGVLVTCGRLTGGGTTFTMQDGAAVCIRLINDLDLPNDQISGTLTITNEPALRPGDTCLDQAPNQVNGIFSDLDCDFCVGQGLGRRQVVADQFILVTPESIDAVKFWGGYFPGDVGGADPLPDNFTVKFRFNDDSSGLDVPGTVISKVQFGPATTRVATGTTLFGVREFEYTIQLDSNEVLLPDEYWVEIYNDTEADPTDDTWFWETGLLDPVNGLPGSVFSSDPPNRPGETWTIDAVHNLSIYISCTPPPTNVNFYTDPVQLAAALLEAGKLHQFTWGFSPNDLPAASVVLLDDPLDIDTHGDDPDDPWGASWPPGVDNVQFTSNMNPGGALAPAGIDGLAFKTAGFLNLVNDMLGAATLIDSFDIVSGAPNSGIHTAMSMNLLSQTLVGSPVPVLFRVTVYDDQDQLLGLIGIPAMDNEEIFLGMITKDEIPIGRIDIWDVLGDGGLNGAEGISSLTAYLDVCDDCSDGSLDECGGDPTCHECETLTGECLCVQSTSCIFAEPCPDGTCSPDFFCCMNVCCGLPICLPLCGSPLAEEPPPFVSTDEIFSGGGPARATR